MVLVHQVCLRSSCCEVVRLPSALDFFAAAGAACARAESMSDIEDDDDEDLWADVDEDCETTITVSENLLEAVSKAPEVVHKGDVDEGKVTWVGPEAAGLQNSVKVNEGKDQHWYKDERCRSCRCTISS